MKIKADYANAPQWKETTIKSSLPKELKCLDEIAHNMWWAWNYEGRDLFKSLDADLYEKCNANPVLLLERLSYDRKEAIVKDKETMAKVKNVYKMFREYMDVKPNSKRPSVAYFCMEYGINQVVKIYSGGLGSGGQIGVQHHQIIVAFRGQLLQGVAVAVAGRDLFHVCHLSSPPVPARHRRRSARSWPPDTLHRWGPCRAMQRNWSYRKRRCP